MEEKKATFRGGVSVDFWLLSNVCVFRDATLWAHFKDVMLCGGLVACFGARELPLFVP